MKKQIDTNIFDYPMPVVLLGTLRDSRPNWMPLGWMSRVNAAPPMVGIGVHRSHASHAAICQTGWFSLNYVTRDMLVRADWCGVHSGADVDKSSIFETESHGVGHAPMAAESPLVLICHMEQSVELPSNTFFIAGIVAARAEEGIIQDGKIIVEKLSPAMLTMPDNRYWNLGQQVGRAWSDGLDWMPHER